MVILWYRKDAFYWYCENQNALRCNGYVVTRLVNHQHHLRSASDHNHAVQTSRAEVVKTIARIKEHAQLTSETVTQVLQAAITNSSQIHHLDLPMESSFLEYLVIPEHMMKTLNG
ncbi:hypothetical protein F8M41_010287 [Gigaspora margarita]|uniref:FLYWCH-type domain-containing protein n=1 Tax=Gigaspora margarita TaxID=4874 RepID=A0A8H4AUN3_GIGMA|nr:hypothetical protein F8M41_010287 [Gigaspora margarita]